MMVGPLGQLMQSVVAGEENWFLHYYTLAHWGVTTRRWRLGVGAHDGGGGEMLTGDD